MAVLQLHRRKAKRDQSPDSFRERNRRDNLVVMPLGELLERVDNMRYAWQQEFHDEFRKLNGLELAGPHLRGWRARLPPGPEPPQSRHAPRAEVPAAWLGRGMATPRRGKVARRAEEGAGLQMMRGLGVMSTEYSVPSTPYRVPSTEYRVPSTAY